MPAARRATKLPTKLATKIGNMDPMDRIDPIDLIDGGPSCGAPSGLTLLFFMVKNQKPRIFHPAAP